MTGIVPSSDSGSAMAGIAVAFALRRNRKITSTTSASASANVTCTSWNELRTDCERSKTVCSLRPCGSPDESVSTCAFTASTTCTALLPGWRWIASTTAGLPLNCARELSSCTLSSTRPRSCRRTGAPLR